MKKFFVSIFSVVIGSLLLMFSSSCVNQPSSPSFEDFFSAGPTNTPCNYPGATCTPTNTPGIMCQATPIFIGTPVSGSLTSGGNDYDPSCDTSTPTNDIVYRLTLASAQSVNITTCSAGTFFDTVVSLLDACDPPSEIGCSDDDGSCGAPGNGTHSTIPIDLSAGTYYIVVDGNGASGTYELLVQ